MTSVADKSRVDKSMELRPSFLSMPELWGTIAIGFMWLAVLFTSIYGGDIVSVNGGSQSTTIPSGVLVALFACLASVAVARRAFRRDAGSRP